MSEGPAISPPIQSAPPQFLVAVDGFDGSGKTTLTSDLKRLFEGRGVSCAVVGRREPDSDDVTGALTDVVLRADASEGEIDELANGHIRLARVLQRALVARRTLSEVVLFDRWIASDLSRLSATCAARLGGQFLELHEELGINLTVRLKVDFETAWTRINARPQEELSPSEKAGRARNEKLFESLEAVWATSWPAGAIELNTVDVDRSTNAARLFGEIERLRASS